MIRGLGIDSVEIERFQSWIHYTPQALRRIFSEKEILYCLSEDSKSAERFAARFAAREAFFKAYSTLPGTDQKPFLFVCKHVSITHSVRNAPVLTVDWHSLGKKENVPHVYVSLTHTKSLAVAVVVLAD